MILSNKYNNNWLKQQLESQEMEMQEMESGKNLKYVFFWGHQPAPSGIISQSCLSQWWDSPFEADGNLYPTAEHYMMAQKARLFNDEDAYQRTLLAKKPAEVKEIGRSVRNFDAVAWEANKFRIVVEGNYHKFNAHSILRDYLVGTNDRVLVEASPVDKIWGIGLTADDERVNDPAKWQGENLLGYALMEVRDLILEQTT